MALHDKKCLISMDLLMGYHQVKVREADRGKTAFTTHMGIFQFNVMPFGLCNAPGTFQRMMDSILCENLYKDVVVYVNDVLTYGNTVDQTLTAWEKHLIKMANADLKCKPRKCKVLPDELALCQQLFQLRSIQEIHAQEVPIRSQPSE